MGSAKVVLYFGVCDECGEWDDSSRHTPEEAAARMLDGLCEACDEKRG